MDSQAASEQSVHPLSQSIQVGLLLVQIGEHHPHNTPGAEAQNGVGIRRRKGQGGSPLLEHFFR